MRKTSNLSEKIKIWVNRHYLQLAVFNLILIVLELLRSAGYFAPFFLISINFIVFIGLLLSVLILGANSKTIFIVSGFFLFITMIFSIFNLTVWAERSAIYFFESTLLAVIMFIVESVDINKD